MPNSQRYIPTLDGWRAIAILGVVLAHGSFSLSQFFGQPSLERLAFGGHGVYLFFGLSGFLICSRLLQEQEQTTTIDLKAFYLRRAFRILPPLLVYLAALSVLHVMGKLPLSLQEVVACLLFFRNYVVGPAAGEVGHFGNYTDHFWSLSVEEHFYLIWPGLLLLLGNKRALWWTIALILSVALWRNLDFRYDLLNQRYFELEVFAHRSDIRLDALLSGCLLAMLLQFERVRRLLTRLLPNLVVIGLGLLYFVISEHKPYLSTLMMALLVPLMIVGTVLSPKSLLSRLLETRALRWIGRLSYSIYIWQELFQVPGTIPRPLPFGSLQEFPLSLLCVLGLSCLSYYLVEQPMVRLGHRLTRSSDRPSSTPR
jgi:peptidoglycan/LPS O-acetylase OafA/YrhL